MIQNQPINIGQLACVAMGVGLLGITHAAEPDYSPGPRIAPGYMGQETGKDLPGSLGKYYGQRAALYRDELRKLAKVHLDGDFNFDGAINDDPADHGAFKRTPPGLIIGKGEMSKLVITITPYKIDYGGRAKVQLEVCGINRDAKSGEYPSWEAERSGMGHIVVWLDASKKKKLLDSRDPQMRACRWSLDDRAFPYNIQVVPRSVYVEGVSSSPKYLGDVRLLLSCFDGNPESSAPMVDSKSTVVSNGSATSNGSSDDPRGQAGSLFKTFRPGFNDILITVMPKPFEKHFINNNAEGVWISPSGQTEK